MKETEKIDGELVRWQKRHGELTAALANATTEHERLESERERLLVAARLDENAAAESALAEHTELQKAAERNERDAKTLLKACERKLSELTKQRVQAVATDNRTQAREVARQRIGLAEQIQRRYDELQPLLRQWFELTTTSANLDEQMGNLAGDHDRAGIRGINSHDLHRQSPIDSFTWLALGYRQAGRIRLAREAHRETFIALERRFLSGLLPSEPTKKGNRRTEDTNTEPAPAAA